MQDMQPVVERQTVHLDAARAPAEGPRRLEDGNGYAVARARVTAAAMPAQPPPSTATRCGSGGVDSVRHRRRGQFSRLASDLTHVRHAIHSLRSGVRAMR